MMIIITIIIQKKKKKKKGHTPFENSGQKCPESIQLSDFNPVVAAAEEEAQVKRNAVRCWIASALVAHVVNTPLEHVRNS